MKTRFTLLTVVAMAVFALTGCTKDAATDPAVDQNTVLLSFSGEKPALENDTRTHFDNGDVFWGPGAERIRVTYAAINGSTPTYVGNIYPSSDGTISADKRTAKFVVPVAFPSVPSADHYQFYSVYPSTVCNGNSSAITGLPSILINIASGQSPTADSFDPVADVMLGRSIRTHDTFPTTSSEHISMFYKRMVAHGCITLSNLGLQASETIRQIEIDSEEGHPMTGNVTMNIESQTVTNTSATVSGVKLNYNEGTTLTDGLFKAWFCSLPFTVTAGQDLTFTVSTSRGTYTRTITARTGGISFLENRYNMLKIDMATAQFTADELDQYILVTSSAQLKVGDKIIITNGSDGIVKAISTTQVFQQHRTATDVIVAGGKITNPTPAVQRLELTAGWLANTFGFYTGSGYLAAGSRSSNILRTATTFDLESCWGVIMDNIKATISSKGENTRNTLRYAVSNGTPLFACYAPDNATVKDPVYIFRQSSASVPKIPLATPANLTAMATGNEILVAWNAVSGAENYTVTCGTLSQTTEGTLVRLTMDYDTNYTVSVVANPFDTNTYTPSEPATTTVTTEADPNPSTEQKIYIDFTKPASITATPALPTTNQSTPPGVKQHVLNGYTWIFNSTGTYYIYTTGGASGGSKLLIGKKDSYIQFPVLSGKKLTGIEFSTPSGSSSSVTVKIVDTSGTVVTGGEQRTLGASETFKFNLSGTTVDTAYRLLVSNANNCQVSNFTLTYNE